MASASLRPNAADAPDSTDNAFRIWQTAGNGVAQGDAIIDMTTMVPRWTHTDAERAEVLRLNAGIFPLIQQGLNAPCYVAPPFRSSSEPKHYHRLFRTLAHLLALDAEARFARGDAAGAIDRLLDAIQLGQMVGQGEASVLGRVVGGASQAIAQRRAWKVIDLLPAAAARRAAHRLQTIFDSWSSYADTLRAEKVTGHVLIEEVFQNGDPTLPALLEQYGGKPQISAAYDDYMDTLILRARGRYGITELSPTPPLPVGPVGEKAHATTWQTRFRVANIEQTQNALLLTALALRTYRAERDGYPTTLAALCPKYLRAVPDDEFALDGPLRYHSGNANDHVLYSVGPDGIDDGGNPIGNPGAATDVQRRLVQPNSVGDIVAGINF